MMASVCGVFSPSSMLLFHKILPVFLLPLGLGLVILFFGVLLRRWLLVWLGIAFLWVMGMPVTGDYLVRQVESNDRRVSVDSLQQADAVVVLGGMVEQVPGVRYGEWGEAADRFEGGVEIYKAGKAPLLLFMGAKMPWAPDARPEGEILSERAVLLGVDEHAIRVTGTVGNTDDEARETGKLLSGILRPRVILVTSAFHMPRASMLFRKAGMRVQEYPVDFRTDYYDELTLVDFFPNTSGLGNSELAIRELIGRAYYVIKRR